MNNATQIHNNIKTETESTTRDTNINVETLKTNTEPNTEQTWHREATGGHAVATGSGPR